MSQTLEELVVKITAENQQYIAALQSSQKATEDATAQMSRVIDQFSTSGSQSTTFLQGAFQTMAGFIGGEAIIGAIEKAGEALEEFFKETVERGVEAASETESAMQKLNTALALSGQYSKKTSEDMEKFASAMEQSSKYGDDAVLSTSALIESLGQLDKDGLQKATKAAMDMSAALGIDLNTAATLVGKAAAGEVSTFTRYGLTIRQGGTAAETFANALDALNQKFGGAAAAQLQTYSGQVALLSNNYSDTVREIGYAITQNPALLSAFGAINGIVKEFGEFLHDNSDSMKKWVAEGLSGILNFAAMAATALDAVARVIDDLKVALAATAEGVVEMAKAANEALHGNFKAAFEAASKTVSNFRSNMNEMGKDTVFSTMAEKILEVKNAADKGFTEIGKQAEAAKGPLNSAIDPIKKMSAAMLDLGDKGKDLAKQLADSVTVPDAVYNAELKKLDADYKAKTKSTAAYFKDLDKLQNQKYKDEQKALDAAYKQKKLSDSAYHKAEEGLAKQIYDEKIELLQKEKEAKDKDRQEELSASATLGSNIMSLAKGNSRELFELGKAASTATAIINTYEGATKALAQGGIVGPIMAAAVITTGMVEVASIQSQQFAQGGTVPGIGFSDSVPSMLTPGEEVVDRSTSAMLKKFLAGQFGQSSGAGSASMSGGHVHVELSFNDDLGKVVETKILKRQKAGISLLNKAVA